MENNKLKEGENHSAIEWKYVYRGACATILTVLGGVSFFVVWRSFVEVNNQTGHLLGHGNLLMAVIIYVLLYLIVGKWMRAFKIGVERVINIISSQSLTFFVVDVLEILVSMAITGQWRFFSDFLYIYALLWLGQSIVFGLLVIPMIKIYRKLFPPIDIIEIYGKKNGLYGKINGLTYKYHVSEAVHISDYSHEELVEKLRSHQAILINDLPSKQKNMIMKACFEMNKRMYAVPKISDIIMKSSEELNLFDTPLFLCRNKEIGRIQRIVKRVFDLAVSIIGLVVFSPVMLVTAIAIYLEDKGPVFYKQDRITENGRVFKILKFRSMIVNAEADGKPHPAGVKDDRITKVGNIIRSCRVDELPQLINILKGDMSVVGPRPERVEHVEKYTKIIPEFTYRTKMKGGLTGYAQVYGKYNTTALDKLKMDLIYITNYSILLDIQIIFETIKIIFLKESSEGFSD